MDSTNNKMVLITKLLGLKPLFNKNIWILSGGQKGIKSSNIEMVLLSDSRLVNNDLSNS